MWRNLTTAFRSNAQLITEENRHLLVSSTTFNPSIHVRDEISICMILGDSDSFGLLCGHQRFHNWRGDRRFSGCHCSTEIWNWKWRVVTRRHTAHSWLPMRACHFIHVGCAVNDAGSPIHTLNWLVSPRERCDFFFSMNDRLKGKHHFAEVWLNQCETCSELGPHPTAWFSLASVHE